MWLHSLKVAQLLRSAACLHTNQSRSYLNHLVCIVLYNQTNQPENLQVKPEEEVNTDHKGTEMEKVIKKKKDTKAAVMYDVLKLLCGDGLRLKAQLINNMYGTGEWLKDVI